MKNFEDLGLYRNYGGYDMKRAGEYTKKILNQSLIYLESIHIG